MVAAPVGAARRRVRLRGRRVGCTGRALANEGAGKRADAQRCWRRVCEDRRPGNVKPGPTRGVVSRPESNEPTPVGSLQAATEGARTEADPSRLRGGQPPTEKRPGSVIVPCYTAVGGMLTGSDENAGKRTVV